MRRPSQNLRLLYIAEAAADFYVVFGDWYGATFVTTFLAIICSIVLYSGRKRLRKAYIVSSEEFLPVEDDLLLKELVANNGCKIRLFFVKLKYDVVNGFAYEFPAPNIRVFLQDGASLDSSLLRALVLHEVGHIRHRHGLAKGLLAVLLMLLTFISHYLLQRVGMFVALAALVAFILASRRWELVADAYAAEIVGQEQYASFLKALYRMNGLDVRPQGLGWLVQWMAGHPPLEVRLERLA